VRRTLDKALHLVERAEGAAKGGQMVDRALPRRLVAVFPVAGPSTSELVMSGRRDAGALVFARARVCARRGRTRSIRFRACRSFGSRRPWSAQPRTSRSGRPRSRSRGCRPCWCHESRARMVSAATDELSAAGGGRAREGRSEGAREGASIMSALHSLRVRVRELWAVKGQEPQLGQLLFGGRHRRGVCAHG
jgi:hypothetical protein